MPTPFTTKLADGPGGGRTLTLTGEIDMSNVDGFQQALEEALSRDGTATVDLTGVDYLDSSGLTSLFRCAEGHELRIVAPRLLARVLQVSGLAGVTTVTIVD